MLAFFHTASANATTFEEIAQEMSPGIATRHIVRSDLLDEASAAGSVSADLLKRIVQAIELSIEPGDDVLVITCSTIGEGADLARHPTARILRVDRPMAQAAVAAGRSLLLAACLESTVQPTRKLLEAERPGLNIETLLIPKAWPMWLAGEKQEYWTSIAMSIAENIDGKDAVVLAQASMAGAADLLKDSSVPVLSSPKLGVQAAIAALTA